VGAHVLGGRGYEDALHRLTLYATVARWLPPT